MPLLYAASFNGSNYLELANYTGNPAAFSYSAFVNLRIAQADKVFFANFLVAGSLGVGFGVASSGNKIKLFLGSNTLTSATALTTGVWTHVVVTYDGTTAKVYFNGSATPDATLTSAVVYGAVPTKNYIGAEPNIAQNLNGRLTGMGVWHKVLSTTEIASLYNSGSGLAGSELSGTLLTGIDSYHDFLNPVSLGTDSSGNAHTYTNNGTVIQGLGPASSSVGYTGLAQPASLVLNPAWSSGMVRAQVFPATGVTTFPDLASLVTYGVSGTVAWTTNTYGNCLAPNDATGQGCPDLATPIADGATALTVSVLAMLNTVTGGGSGNRCLWVQLGGSAQNGLLLNAGLLQFILGNTTNLTVDPPPLNTPVLITCRLTAAGVRSIWYGSTKVAERTDAGITWAVTGASFGLGTSPSPVLLNRNWSGQINGGHVWTNARSDAEISSLAGDFFAPVRPTSGGSMAWTLSQKAGNEALSSGTTITVSFPGAVTAGSLIVVGVVQYNALADTLTVSDNKGNSYASAGTRAAIAGPGIAAIYWGIATTGGSSFQVTFSVSTAGSYLTLMIGEFSVGAGATVSVEGYSTGTGTSGNFDSGLITPVTSGDLVVGVVNSTNVTGAVAGSGFTMPTEWNWVSGAGAPAVMEYQLAASAPLNATFTYGGAATWAMAGAAFKATASGSVAAGGASLLMGL